MLSGMEEGIIRLHIHCPRSPGFVGQACAFGNIVVIAGGGSSGSLGKLFTTSVFSVLPLKWWYLISDTTVAAVLAIRRSLHRTRYLLCGCTHSNMAAPSSVLFLCKLASRAPASKQ